MRNHAYPHRPVSQAKVAVLAATAAHEEQSEPLYTAAIWTLAVLSSLVLVIH